MHDQAHWLPDFRPKMIIHPDAVPCAVIVEFLAKDEHAQRCRTLHEQIDAGPCAVPIFRPKMCVQMCTDAGPCAAVTSFQAKHESSFRTGPCAMDIRF
jgi:hypothetical protein